MKSEKNFSTDTVKIMIWQELPSENSVGIKKCFFLDRIDCDYGNCPHGENCEMMKQVFAFLDSLNEK